MTRDKVLSMLINSAEHISGASISEELGISRAAVNAAVQSLRTDGYQIDSCTNKGYKLISRPDRLTVGDIEAILGPERMKTVHVETTVDSTNKRLKELGYDGCPSGTVIIANEQTSGRGRLGRSFSSPSDTGIYLSILFRPDTSPSDTSTVTARAAVAVSDAISRAVGVTPGIKWVNDLVLGGHKICGILTELSIESETSRIDNIVIGIGVNVNNRIEDFPEEIRSTASSLAMECPDKRDKLNRSDIAAHMVLELDRLIKSWPDDSEYYLKRYRELSATVGQEVTVFPVAGRKDTAVQGRRGTAVAINDDFSLKVVYDDGTDEDLSSGEVSVRGLYGYA